MSIERLVETVKRAGWPWKMARIEDVNFEFLDYEEIVISHPEKGDSTPRLQLVF